MHKVLTFELLGHSVSIRILKFGFLSFSWLEHVGF